MNSISRKEYLQLKMPTEEVPVSDHRRLELALHTLGYEYVTFPLKVLRKLYPLCRNAGFDITVTLVHRETDWVVTDVEPGDNVIMNVELITPIAIEKGLRFAIREGGRTVGSGVVTEIYE